MPGFEEAIHAALFGPEAKKVRIGSHDFNVKKMSYRGTESHVIADGHISHAVKGVPDEQVRFSLSVDRSSFVPTAGPVAVSSNYVTDFVVINHRIGSYILGQFVPPAGAAASLCTPAVRALADYVQKKVIGNWQEACNELMAAIGTGLSIALRTRALEVPPHHVRIDRNPMSPSPGPIPRRKRHVP